MLSRAELGVGVYPEDKDDLVGNIPLVINYITLLNIVVMHNLLRYRKVVR